MTITRRQLLEELKPSYGQLRSVNDISVIRRELGQSDYDSQQLSPEDAQAVREYLAKQGNISNGNGKHAQQPQADNNTTTLAVAQKEQQKALLQVGAQQGAQAANLVNRGMQLGFAKQHLKNIQGATQALAAGLDTTDMGDDISDAEILAGIGEDFFIEASVQEIFQLPEAQ